MTSTTTLNTSNDSDDGGSSSSTTTTSSSGGSSSSSNQSAAATNSNATTATTTTTATATNNTTTTATTTNSSSSSSSSSDFMNIGNKAAAATAATADTNNSRADTATVNNIEAEYNQILERNGWHRIYQDIRERCEREAYEKHFVTIESDKAHNRCLNRYRDVNPYDHSRIVLHRGRVDYINANLVKLERADRKYILTQGPLADTVGHFWLMVWEQKTKAILMLNKLMEKKQVKCYMYWPSKKGPDNALKLDEVKLSVEYLRCEEYRNYSRRWFKLTDIESKQSREIIQFHYTTWPDFGIPSSPVAFLQFLKQVRDSGALDPDVGPAVVHCSAGIGRSGTFCLVDCCLVLIDKQGVNNVSVQDVLYELRRYRMGLIQTADQLYFSYQAIIEGIRLLKDQTFLEYNEEPFICNDDDEEPNDQSTSMDETPPPLPPRTHSLPLAGGSNAGGNLTLHLPHSQPPAGQSKPLPMIPASESFSDDLYNGRNTKTNNKDALNNFINNERNNDSMSNRPLPPLPPSHKNTLVRVHESESDDKDSLDGSDDDEDDDDDHIHLHDAADNDDEEEEEMERNDNVLLDNDAINANVQNGNGNPQEYEDVKAELSASAVLENATKTVNGIEVPPPTTNSAMSAEQNELKQRRRIDRQRNIEQKVAEIKRKQRESEDGKHTAKKRRSLVAYITAGVVVGVVCVYAYTKLAG